MKHQLRTLATPLGGLLLALALIAGPTQPADAHIYDGLAEWSCAITRPAPQAGWALSHAVPVFLTSSYVIENCRAYTAGGRVWCWQAWHWFESGDTVLYGGYTDYYSGGCPTNV